MPRERIHPASGLWARIVRAVRSFGPAPEAEAGVASGGTVGRAQGGRRLLVATVLLSGLGIPARPAAAAEAHEYREESVFIYYFTQFVSWPATAFADAKAPFVIGILGRDPFGAYLEGAVRDQRADGRQIEIRRFSKVEEVKLCHILYVSRSQEADLGHVLWALGKRSVLTVSDIDGFSRAGGMIRFLTEDNKVRFRINVDAAESAGLVISSKLLRPSDIISGQGG